LAFLVLYIWQALFVKPAPKPALASNPPPSASATATPEAPPTSAPSAPAPTAAAPSGPTKAPLGPDATVAAATPLVSENAERDVRIETRDVIAVFTNRGARLKSWRLKVYLDAKGQPQELVENSIPGQPPPFTLRTSDASLDNTLNSALYAVTGEPATASESSGPIDLRFEYRDSAGLHALKTFHLDQRSFIVTFYPEITEGDRVVTPTIVWGPAVGDVGEVSRYTKKAEGLVFKDGKVSRLQTKDLATHPIADGDFKYGGVDDNYFLTVALNPGPSSVTFQPLSIPAPGD